MQFEAARMHVVTVSGYLGDGSVVTTGFSRAGCGEVQIPAQPRFCCHSCQWVCVLLGKTVVQCSLKLKCGDCVGLSWRRIRRNHGIFARWLWRGADPSPASLLLPFLSVGLRAARKDSSAVQFEAEVW